MEAKELFEKLSKLKENYHAHVNECRDIASRLDALYLESKGGEQNFGLQWMLTRLFLLGFKYDCLVPEWKNMSYLKTCPTSDDYKEYYKDLVTMIKCEGDTDETKKRHLIDKDTMRLLEVYDIELQEFTELLGIYYVSKLYFTDLQNTIIDSYIKFFKKAYHII